MKEHITQSPIIPPWLYGASTPVAVVVAIAVSNRFADLWLIILSWVAAVVAVATVMTLLTTFFFYGDIILNENGIREERRWRPTQTSWKEIIQCSAVVTENTHVLVLVRRGGTPLTKTGSKILFYLCNPGKLIFLPDDKLSRAFVETWYGKPDIVRSE